MAIPSYRVHRLATPEGRSERQLLGTDEYGPVRRADYMKGTIEITGYHNKVVDGKIQWVAVDKKKNEYPVPEQFASMYNDKHLAIKKVKYDMASVLDLPQEEVYIPLRTDLS